MSATKTIHAATVLAKVESSYNTDPTPSASTDAVLFMKPFEKPRIAHGYDGDRGIQPGGYGRLIRAPKLGRTVSGVLRTELKGNGAAYTSSAVVLPNGLQALLRASGFAAAVTTTGGSEKWTFTPTGAATAPTSVTLYEYFNGELWVICGVYCSLTIRAQNAGIPVFEFAYTGTMAAAVTDSTPATPTYHDETVIPPSFAAATAVTWGSWNTGVVRSWEFRQGRSIDSPRTNLNNAAGHSGFTPGAWDPVVELTAEATSLVSTPYHSTSGLNPYVLSKNATTGMGLTFQCGATQYNRWNLAFTGVQLMDDPEVVDEDPAALWRLRLRPYSAAAGPAVGGFTLTAD